QFGLYGAYPSVFRVSDPLGGFTSVSKPFNVVQKVRPQALAGRATSAVTGLPLANCVLGLIPLSTSPALLLTLTDSNGSYFFYVPQDSYVLVAFRPDALSNANLLHVVPCNEIVSNNVAFTNGPIWIAGRLTDSATGQGIGGILVDANSTNNFESPAFTDTN